MKGLPTSFMMVFIYLFKNEIYGQLLTNDSRCFDGTRWHPTKEMKYLKANKTAHVLKYPPDISNYRDDVDCVWHMKTDFPDHIIVMTFIYLGISKDGNNCGMSDYIKIEEIEDFSVKQKTFCGSFSASDNLCVVSKTRALKIHFHSDDTHNNAGFTIRYFSSKLDHVNGDCEQGQANRQTNTGDTAPIIIEVATTVTMVVIFIVIMAFVLICAQKYKHTRQCVIPATDGPKPCATIPNPMATPSNVGSFQQPTTNHDQRIFLNRQQNMHIVDNNRNTQRPHHVRWEVLNISDDSGDENENVGGSRRRAISDITCFSPPPSYEESFQDRVLPGVQMHSFTPEGFGVAQTTVKQENGDVSGHCEQSRI